MIKHTTTTILNDFWVLLKDHQARRDFAESSGIGYDHLKKICLYDAGASIPALNRISEQMSLKGWAFSAGQLADDLSKNRKIKDEARKQRRSGSEVV